MSLGSAGQLIVRRGGAFRSLLVEQELSCMLVRVYIRFTIGALPTGNVAFCENARGLISPRSFYIGARETCQGNGIGLHTQAKLVRHSEL